MIPSMIRRAEWQEVLDVEAERWSSKSCEQLMAELHDVHVYEVEKEAKRYQVEVELLENTNEYIHVGVAIDDGSLPASLAPLTHSFIRHKSRNS
jgi:hypothetical protein